MHDAFTTHSVYMYNIRVQKKYIYIYIDFTHEMYIHSTCETSKRRVHYMIVFARLRNSADRLISRSQVQPRC